VSSLNLFVLCKLQCHFFSYAYAALLDKDNDMAFVRLRGPMWLSKRQR